jgi:hypothetical protein
VTKLDFKNLSNYKTVLVLLIIIILNLTTFALLYRLDIFVNGDLYSYGLIFSHNWANNYWHYNQLLWIYLGGATTIVACAIAPHYLHSKKPSGFSRLFGFFLPVAALIYQALSLYFLGQLDFVAKNSLYQYGLNLTFDWTPIYEPVYNVSFALLLTSLLLLVIPAIRSLDLFKNR